MTNSRQDLETLASRLASRIIDENGRPNTNAINEIVRNTQFACINSKQFGYYLAQQLKDKHFAKRVYQPSVVNLACKPSTQDDLESDWVGYWCQQLKIARVYHRKIWELCYVLQALSERAMLRTGNKGIGFGCGEEPLPSLLASMGIDVTVTDLDPAQSTTGWMQTGQHTTTIDRAWSSELVGREVFDQHVSLQYVDMNHVPVQLAGHYDFCWSICAFEHLGSISNGLDFVENSLSVLKPGGVAVHTTEYNFEDRETIDNWPTVLFQKRHFEELSQRLASRGHHVMPLDFRIGDGLLDMFVDVPPYHYHNMPQEPHIKLVVDGFPCTCFGLIVRKAG
jgi:2-polyprenyl-3-methyl-5-hydroxy-6-metoxy-1,4-benzoquinol methylase